ncbi:MAG: FtsH protease activity modulator HflK [Methylomicrobium sp.]
MAWKNENNEQHGLGETPKTDWEAQFETFQRKFKHQLRDFYQQNAKRLIGYTLSALAIAWLASGVYIVDQGNRGVETRFGAYLATTMPGPHWHLPYPIEDVAVVNVEKQRFIEVGYQSDGRQLGAGPVLPESLMLTKDENIISVRLAIQYQINDAKDYLFSIKNPEVTLKQVTESIERGVIGKNDMDFILTEGRSQIASAIKDQVQQAMDEYQSGLRIASVNLQDAQPPEEVQNAFEDAIRAREDKQRLINEAEAYANEVIPKARGAAARLIQEAEAYEAQVVAKASGDTQRFEQLLTEYEKAPKITRKRLYLEAKENLFSHTNKVLVDVENGNSMFYLPVDQMQRNAEQAHTAQPATDKAPVVSTAKAEEVAKTHRPSSIRTSRGRL